MPSPRVITLATAGRALRGFIPTYFDILGREWDRAWTEAKSAFPNPLTMALAFISFFGSVPFLPLYTVVENFGRSMLPNARYYRRFVITGYDAFKLCTEITSKASLKAGLVDTSLLEDFIVWLSKRFFTVISGGGFVSKLRAMIGLKTEADVLRFFKNSALKQLWLTVLRWALVWFGVGYAMITMLVIGLYWNDWFEGLRQDSKKVYVKKRHRDRVKRRKA